MNDIAADDLNANHLVYGHNQIIIYGQQSRLPWLAALVIEHFGIELEIAVVGIAVAPKPLMPGRLHGEFRPRDILLEEQQAK